MPYYKHCKESITAYGTENMDLQSLLAVLAGPKVDPQTVSQLSAMGAQGLANITKDELLAIPGIGDRSADVILASIGLGGVMAKQNKIKHHIIRGPEDAFEHLMHLGAKLQEEFVVLLLNTKNEVIAERTVFKGDLNSSTVHPRECFKEALKVSAASMVVVHNHPSGDAEPSFEDICVTRRLIEAGKVIGIEVRDHIIIGHGRYVSLKEKGYV